MLDLSSVIPVPGGNRAPGHMAVTWVIKVISVCGDVHRQRSNELNVHKHCVG